MLFLIVWLPGLLSGQESSGLKEHRFIPLSDTIRVDSLSLIPGSVSLLAGKQPLHDSLYTTDHVGARVFLSPALRHITDTLTIRYRTFPVRLDKTYRYLEPGQNRIDPVQYNSLIHGRKPGSRAATSTDRANLFTTGDLSRGIRIGTTQDASLQSSLNLRISGPINEEFSIEAQLSDASIPVQPEGNTAQIQEFDRMHIRLHSDKTRIQAGDFVLDQSVGTFQRMNKNLQGIQVEAGSRFSTRSTAAVVKGKFNRMKISGQEGSQGPYRLTGNEGEQYIQVIAGSERIYLDGILLKRGENEDYTINYNTAELSFTPKILITKDKRITAQFEYTDRSYVRFVLASENHWKGEKGSLYLNLFSESDAKNQPLLQDLSVEQKNLLAAIGDQLDQAVVNNWYQSGFSDDRVLYRKTDTLVNGVSWSDILVYSTNPERAVWQAGFSWVGENRGHYRPVQSSANGQVYEWIAPLNGVPQGSYEPVTRLVTPKSKQLYTLGGEAQAGRRMQVKGELSFSASDLNTFSPLDQDDNQGTGILAEITRTDPLLADSSLLLSSYIRYRRVGKQYEALEPFREVEFERDWNLVNGLPEGHENLLETGISLNRADSLHMQYRFEYLSYTADWQASRHHTSGRWVAGRNAISWQGSRMQASDAFRNSAFLRHRVDISRDFRFMRLTLSEQHEGNEWVNTSQTTLADGSFRFQEWYLRLDAPDEQSFPWFVQLRQRNDYLPDSSGFIRSYASLENSAGIRYTGKKGQLSALSWNFRQLEPEKGLEGTAPENTTTIRLEEQFTLSEGLIRSGTFYEVGSGLERKQEYYYLQVPAGQGYYSWTDYNGNEVKELDEFEPAVFADQASWIRVYRPGTDYLPVFTNRFTQTLNVNPAVKVSDETHPLRFLRLFSNQFSYTGNRKNREAGWLTTMNPLGMADSLLVSMQSQLRNNLSFNSPQRKFGMDYVYQQAFTQHLMTYGTDRRNNHAHALLTRIRPIDPLWIINRLETGQTAFASGFFTNRNYVIDYTRNTLEVTIEATDQIRVKMEWVSGWEHNPGGGEQSRQQQVELGADLQAPGKGLIHLDLNYLHFDYTGEADSPVGYVMLKGFRPGHNGMANLGIRRKITEVIQLDLQYGLRLSGNQAPIHTGNLAVRAVF